MKSDILVSGLPQFSHSAAGVRLYTGCNYTGIVSPPIPPGIHPYGDVIGSSFPNDSLYSLTLPNDGTTVTLTGNALSGNWGGTLNVSQSMPCLINVVAGGISNWAGVASALFVQPPNSYVAYIPSSVLSFGQTLTLSCPPRMGINKIISVFYGNDQSSPLCLNTASYTAYLIDGFTKLCLNLNKCSYLFGSLFDTDPCSGISKAMIVMWSCGYTSATSTFSGETPCGCAKHDSL